MRLSGAGSLAVAAARARRAFSRNHKSCVARTGRLPFSRIRTCPGLVILSLASFSGLARPAHSSAVMPVRPY